MSIKVDNRLLSKEQAMKIIADSLDSSLRGWAGEATPVSELAESVFDALQKCPVDEQEAYLFHMNCGVR